MKYLSLVCLAVVVSLVGCTRVVVVKNNSDECSNSVEISPDQITAISECGVSESLTEVKVE